MLENWEKLASKHSIERPILLTFVNLSTIFCPRLHVKTVDLADGMLFETFTFSMMRCNLTNVCIYFVRFIRSN